MRRVLAVLGLVVPLAACGGDPSAPPPGGRFDAVRATAATEAHPERWCDVWFEADRAPRLALPKNLAAVTRAPSPLAAAGDRWTWINVWATWCAPCRRELPIVARWRESLSAAGRPVDLWYVSIDDDASALRQEIARTAPDAMPGAILHLPSSDLEPWIATFAKDPSSTVPQQILLGPGGVVRCLRAGAITDADRPEIDALLR